MPGWSSSPPYNAPIRNGTSHECTASHGTHGRRYGSASTEVSRVDTSPLERGSVTTSRSRVATSASPSRVVTPASLSGLPAPTTRLTASASENGDVATQTSVRSARR